MGWLNLASFFGWIFLAASAWVLGGCKRPVSWRTVLGAGGLMLAMGLAVFLLPPSRTVLTWVNDAVVAVLGAGNEGARFLFGPLALNAGETTSSGEPSIGFVLAAQVLPAVIFFAALMAVFYHLRLIQPVIRLFAWVFHRFLRISGAESLSGSSNIFVGVESVMTVRPYIVSMTRSELLTVLTCGMSTVASTTLVIYVVFLGESFPNIAGHLISASFLSIPAAVVVSKLMLPETGEPVTLGRVPPIDESERQGNFMAALSAGAWDGLKLAAGIATLLIAVLGVVGIINLVLAKLSGPFGGEIDTGRVIGWLFWPATWLLGIESADAASASRLLGERVILTEIVAYRDLGRLAAEGALSARTLLVLSYALCGFAHVASVGIFVGGVGALAPSRRTDIAGLGMLALIGSTIATLMTGALAGLFYHGQQGILGL
jgi:CNT family concentrative nucleoside transporter